ncbi:uncharacterized protein LOC115876144 [Sitophilus oryzae]|uniref:Uncharacterized protein LOC115876144 n=1 Tax=Sitophilus oryzae TaxID=7048 RepID=A0A6J2XA25_SITOR|nr:uncharacterized protein LOC115876144 [Sitophilus oryzae]
MDLKSMNYKQYTHSEIFQRKQLPAHYTSGNLTASGTPLQFNNEAFIPVDAITTTNTKIEKWKSKALHGKHANQLTQPHIDIAASNAWLTQGISERPRLPRISNKFKAEVIINKLNTVLKKHLEAVENIEEIQDAIYAAAITVLDFNGQKVISPEASQTKHSPLGKPSWAIRLQQQIDNFRAEADIIAEYLNNNTSPKVKAKIEKIRHQLKISRNSQSMRRKLTEHRDTLRQKTKAKGARLGRYNETTKRKQQNQMFIKNENKFYKTLTSTNSPEQLNSVQNNNSDTHFQEYWESIWASNEDADLTAPWLTNVERATQNLTDMPQTTFTDMDVSQALKKAKNWKAPGYDQIHNFWLKKFTASHESLARCFTKALNDPTTLPRHISEGITYLIHKKGDQNNPHNYRPITCLSVFYKLLTAMVNDKIYQHCESNNIFAFEQKGCIRKAMGCKEQLLIDSVIMKKAQAQKRNLHTCYIDYSKAFDSIPHNWLLKILDIYKISDNVKAMLTYIMKSWRITLKLNNKNIGKADIRCGIYQGDSLSPTWFCLALNPLSQLLKNNNAGFRIKMRDRTRYSHLLYVDDLKLYAESKQQLESLLTVTQFSDDIKMNFGLDKCATIEIKKGHVVKTEENFMNIPCLEPDDTYKYFGIQQNLGIPHTNLKKEAMEKYKSRPTKLLNTKLNSKNLTRAINCWAIPTLSYSFGILKWSDTDLDELDKTTRRTLTKFRCLHPNSSIQRLYMPRSEGGRGLLNIKSLCKSQERKMREYFLQHTHPNIQTVVELTKHIHLSI